MGLIKIILWILVLLLAIIGLWIVVFMIKEPGVMLNVTEIPQQIMNRT